MAADCITLSRVLFSLSLFVLPPDAALFAVFYLLCGITDVLDGFLARRLHTESARGAVLDSAADLVFAAVYAVRILPGLSVPVWIWIWAALIAAVKVPVVIAASCKHHKLTISHSFANKLTGVLLFLLPLSTCMADISCGGALACAAATFAAVEEVRHGKDG